ncbi:fungal protein [Schizosaccharomyces japonicus yFS275]|uniref:Fungal protein n=1 Tax=Schizosaccharomyces japonicus (strain yFS275 / FY16936) TaxID=402676 RepID=B6K8C4_SCHJY|nr:fungal protein [Schizosaccharomyces japonicus yFS275]EEB09778.2 fungal protein [Schizosaccharomyces japonicus yFS275]
MELSDIEQFISENNSYLSEVPEPSLVFSPYIHSNPSLNAIPQHEGILFIPPPSLPIDSLEVKAKTLKRSRPSQTIHELLTPINSNTLNQLHFQYQQQQLQQRQPQTQQTQQTLDALEPHETTDFFACGLNAAPTYLTDSVNDTENQLPPVYLASTQINSPYIHYGKTWPVPSKPDGGTLQLQHYRTLPPNFPINPLFPLFYVSIPAPTSIYTPATDDSGVVYTENLPDYDLYTPRYSKGAGMEKEALCPVCFEAKKEVWLRTKTSAYWYHMNFAHGINTKGQQYLPPTAFRTVPLGRPKRTIGIPDRKTIIQGKCHQCRRWIGCQGRKNKDPKIMEIFWWKHANKCHKSAPDETGFFTKPQCNAV